MVEKYVLKYNNSIICLSLLDQITVFSGTHINALIAKTQAETVSSVCVSVCLCVCVVSNCCPPSLHSLVHISMLS